MALLDLFRQFYVNDVRRIRNFTRYFVYKYENFEYYRLISVRAQMMQHKYVNKDKMAEEQELNKDEEWRWVFHLKPQKIKKYGRFWKPATSNESSNQEKK